MVNITGKVITVLNNTNNNCQTKDANLWLTGLQRSETKKNFFYFFANCVIQTILR